MPDKVGCGWPDYCWLGKGCTADGMWSIAMAAARRLISFAVAIQGWHAWPCSAALE